MKASSKNKSTALEIVVEAPAQGSWERAAKWANAVRSFTRCTVAAQVMTGLELLALHREHEITQGGDRKSNPHNAVLNWPELIRQHCDISDDTGYRWMDMAQHAGDRIKLLHGIDIIGTPLGNFTAKQLGQIETAVQELTDGKTQTAFLRECRVLRKLSPKELGWSEQDITRIEDMRILAKAAKGQLTEDAEYSVGQLSEEARQEFIAALPATIAACEAGELRPARAWAGLFGKASTDGKKRAETNHDENLYNGLAKLKTSLPHWYDMSARGRTRYIQTFVEIIQNMPDELRIKISEALKK
ncbi:MAG: hypothetical protein LBV12_06495 [Puniceicoccales bacterium]|jgi:hypothetical protein|nr:hypothetical protein [Puniceicoccales bacterium]